MAVLHARDCVAKLRLAHSRHVDDPWFNELIELLHDRSPEFAAWWDEHNVQLPSDGVKVYEHPEAGRLTFDYTLLDAGGEQGKTLHLVTYLPSPGTDTQAKMEALLGAAAAPARSREAVAAATASATSRSN